MKMSRHDNDEQFMKIAFNKAFEHLGSTKENPSVGCVVVKNNSIISSGKTAIGGRPHAEESALKKNINFKNSTLYVTLEPCAHYGLTPPCINIIKKKGIKKVCYPVLDPDKRTFNKAKKILNKKNIKVKIGILKNTSLNFYKSYFLSKKKHSLPFVDLKIAISKDYFSVNKKNKWITNEFSRAKGHLLRSKYDCIFSTYKTVNKDDSMLNCRISGMQHLSPSRVILDPKNKLKKNLKLFKTSKKIKTYVITNTLKKSRENFLKSKKIHIIKIKNENKIIPYNKILMELKKRGFFRILCEAGSNTSRSFLKSNLVNNLYVFMSQRRLGKNGQNSFKKELSNLDLSNKNMLKINLYGDLLYKLKIK